MKLKGQQISQQRAGDEQPPESFYVHVDLDRVPLIVPFEIQLAQRQEADETLRQIAAAIEFDLACLLQGVDPRPRGRG